MGTAGDRGPAVPLRILPPAPATSRPGSRNRHPAGARRSLTAHKPRCRKQPHRQLLQAHSGRPSAARQGDSSSGFSRRQAPPAPSGAGSRRAADRSCWQPPALGGPPAARPLPASAPELALRRCRLQQSGGMLPARLRVLPLRLMERPRAGGERAEPVAGCYRSRSDRCAGRRGPGIIETRAGAAPSPAGQPHPARTPQPSPLPRGLSPSPAS